jgi:hypothetical protein
MFIISFIQARKSCLVEKCRLYEIISRQVKRVSKIPGYNVLINYRKLHRKYLLFTIMLYDYEEFQCGNSLKMKLAKQRGERAKTRKAVLSKEIFCRALLFRFGSDCTQGLHCKSALFLYFNCVIFTILILSLFKLNF